MPARIRLRDLTPEERHGLESLARSRTAPARSVERARIVLASAAGRRVGDIADELNVSRPTISTWVRRFNEGGPAALEDLPRSGRPPTYAEPQRAEDLAAALTDPKALGLPFGCWTLDRLRAYLDEHKEIPIRRSRIDELLRAEGLRWRHQETWFGERVDPESAEKRGSSRPSTRSRRRAPSSSASTRWGRSRPGAIPASSPPAPGRGTRPTAAVGAPPGGPCGRSTTAGGARGISSGPSGLAPARR